MKRYMFIISLIFYLNNLNSQVSNIIMNPMQGKGYMLLSNDNLINYYVIEYIKKTYLSEQEVNIEILDRIEIVGKNFFKVNEELIYQSNVFLRIIAHKNNGTINIEEVPINDIPTQVLGQESIFHGFWQCVGTNYAYWITQNEIINTFTNTTIGYYMDVQPGWKVPTTGYQNGNPSTGLIVNWNDLNYHYQYFSESQMLTFSNAITACFPNPYLINNVPYQQYYGIPDLHNYYNTPWPVQDGQVISFTNPYPNKIFKSSDGDIITSSKVYGIKKGLGPWSGSNTTGCLTTSLLTITPAAFTNDISYAINTINTNTQSNPLNCFMPSLSCNQSITPLLMPTILKARTEEAPSLDSIVWPWDLLQSIENIYNEQVDLGWEEKYIELQIFKISGTRFQVADLLIADLYDNNGEKIETGIPMSTGLYMIGVLLDDGNYIYFISEVKGEFEDNQSQLKDYFSFTIYPVPVIDQEFNINISSSRDLNVRYKLLDFNMNLLYETEIEIMDGASESIQINPSQEIPSGFLINQFIFRDGSQISVLTTKTQ